MRPIFRAILFILSAGLLILGTWLFVSGLGSGIDLAQLDVIVGRDLAWSVIKVFGGLVMDGIGIFVFIGFVITLIDDD